MKNLIATDDYNAWRTLLSNILSKFGKVPGNVPDWKGTTVDINEPSKSSHIEDLKQDTIHTTQIISYIPDVSDLDFGDYSVGKPTLLDTKTKIESILNNMYNTCLHNTDYSNRSHDSSDCVVRSDKTVHSDNTVKGGNKACDLL